MNDSRQITLAIESAIGGGSLSLLRDGSEIDAWTGTADVSKAEDLLANIDEMLTRSGVGRKEIGLLAVSAGPGSFTGIRIGIATALGLKMGLGIPMASQSALTAMAHSDNDMPAFVAALPVGRNAVCIQRFETSDGSTSPTEDAHTISEAEFAGLVASNRSEKLLLHEGLFDKFETAENVVNFGRNTAFAIGKLCISRPDIVTEPLFISKNF